MANYRWDDKDNLVLYIENERIDLDTKGLEYARQFGALTSWIGKYALPALMGAAESGELAGDDLDVAVNILSGIMDFGFSAESMIELAGILINKDREFVEEFFDPGWFIEALLRSYDYRSGVKVAFTRLYERFFVATPTEPKNAEGEAHD